jgi:hypothetical protein
MKTCLKTSAWIISFAMCTVPAANAQDREHQHVVAQEELHQEIARRAATRQSNEKAVRHLLTSDAGRQALQSAKVDYAKVDQAIGQLSDVEVAKLADRARHAEDDFAAGSISAKTLAYIILAVVVIVTIIVIIEKV